jgi:hypothetical protein
VSDFAKINGILAMNARYTSYCQVADLADSQDFLTQIRHHLHQNPELSFKEIATSELVASLTPHWFPVAQYFPASLQVESQRL